MFRLQRQAAPLARGAMKMCRSRPGLGIGRPHLIQPKMTRALPFDHSGESAQSAWAGLSFVSSVFGIGCSMAIGDMICQKLASDDGYNRDRGITMFVTGTFITGPISYTWQMFLERQVPGKSVRAIVQKTLMNSAYAFTISLPVMFTAVTLLSRTKDGRRKTWPDAVAKIREDLVPTFLAGCLYWPFWNCITFRFVAAKNRAVVGSLIGTVWNIYLASVANKNIVDQNSSADS